MRRRTIVLALVELVCLVMCGAGGWLALRTDTARFVVPGASEVHVQSIRPGTHLITFNATEPSADWADQLDRRLRDQGWLPPDFSGATAQFTIYSYVNLYWFGSIWEEADLHGDAQHARIIVRRWLRLRWLFDQSFEF
jgi:hypothetical protein